MLSKSPNIIKNNTQLAEEYAIAICINDVNYAVMMVTPADLEDYVIGFLFNEQIILANKDIHDIHIDIDHEHFSIQANITLANRCLNKIFEKKRQIAGQSGCGICGVEALKHAMPELPPLAVSPNINKQELTHLRSECQKWQTFANASGALHAAFLLDDTGQILQCREDIGRHNALDKLIGFMLVKKISAHSNMILITSRCSIELVHKTINIGVKYLISLASPSRLALHSAQKANLHLVHLSKNDGALSHDISNIEKANYEK